MKRPDPNRQLEYLLVDNLRLTAQARYEVLGDLQYLQVGAGVMVMFGAAEPGERGR